MATRGVIIIDTKNENIGHVAFIPIGMVDVSTVDLTPLTSKKTNRVVKGMDIHFATFLASLLAFFSIKRSKVKVGTDISNRRGVWNKGGGLEKISNSNKEKNFGKVG